MHSIYVLYHLEKFFIIKKETTLMLSQDIIDQQVQRPLCEISFTLFINNTVQREQYIGWILVDFFTGLFKSIIVVLTKVFAKIFENLASDDFLNDVTHSHLFS